MSGSEFNSLADMVTFPAKWAAIVLYLFTAGLGQQQAFADQTKDYPLVAADTLERMLRVPPENELAAHTETDDTTNQDNVDPKMAKAVSAYFQERLNTSVSVNLDIFPHKLPKSVATFPKYYGWVRLTNSDEKLVTQGAIRITALSPTKFKVTHFIDRQVISEHPSTLENIFPNDVLPLALDKLANS